MEFWKEVHFRFLSKYRHEQKINELGLVKLQHLILLGYTQLLLILHNYHEWIYIFFLHLVSMNTNIV